MAVSYYYYTAEPAEGQKFLGEGAICNSRYLMDQVLLLIRPKFEGGGAAHSRMGHYFFSYLRTWEVDLIEIVEIMPQMWQYVIFLSLKPTKVTSNFILN